MKIRNTDRSFGLIAIIFHWVMAALFFLQFWIGLTMESEADHAVKAALLSRHISLGFLILSLWVLRALWVLTSRRPALPMQMDQTERLLARISHWLLFLLLAITPLTGWSILSTVQQLVPLPIRVFGDVVVPRLPLAATSHASGLWMTLHAFLAYFMLVLAAVHALAAMRHQFTRKDGLLMRMILPGRQLTGDAEE